MTSKGRSKGKQIGELPTSRQELSEYLNDVLTQCFQKLNLRNTRNVERTSYMRIIIAAVEAQTGILKDADLEDLKVRIEELEKVKP